LKNHKDRLENEAELESGLNRDKDDEIENQCGRIDDLEA
jgi:hypothetical protein